MVLWDFGHGLSGCGFWFQVVRETWGLSGKRVNDYTLYTGALGTAFLVFK